MQIHNHRLVGHPFKLARSYSTSRINPQMIVLHDTAGHLTKGNCVSWFQNKQCKVSAHLVVERDGSVTQMVPFNQKAYHAGQSSWNGRKWCNGFSIGIEIVNPGMCDKNGCAWFNKGSGYGSEAVQKKQSKEHGIGFWMDYTPEQIRTVKELCRALMDEYPDCNEIVTHWMISPGRKIDTNPLFPLEEVRDYAEGKVEVVEPVAAPVQAPVPAPEQPVTAKDLKKTSQKVWFLVWWQRLHKAVVGVFAGASIADALGYSRGIFSDVNAIVPDQSKALLIGFGLVALAGGGFVLARIVKDANEGRYVPSGDVGEGPANPELVPQAG